MNIRATKIQYPCNIIERRHKHTIGMLTCKRLSYPYQLFRSIHTCILHRVYLYRILRDGRTVGPYISQRIKISTQRDSTLTSKVKSQCLYGIDRVHHAIDTHLWTIYASKLSAQPFWNCWCARHF